MVAMHQASKWLTMRKRATRADGQEIRSDFWISSREPTGIRKINTCFCCMTSFSHVLAVFHGDVIHGVGSIFVRLTPQLLHVAPGCSAAMQEEQPKGCCSMRRR
jgi:hypothetical protein